MMNRVGALGVLLLPLCAGAETLFEGSMQSWRSNDKSGNVRCYTLTEETVKSGGLLELQLSIGWKGVKQERPSYDFSGVMVTAVGKGRKGETFYLMDSNLGWGDQPMDTWRVSGMMMPPDTCTNILVRVGLFEASGQVEFGDAKITLTSCDPAKRIKDYDIYGKKVDLDYMDWYPPAPHADPVLDGGSTFATFCIDSPLKTFDRFTPDTRQLTGSFATVAAAGEVRDVFLGVYAAEEVRSLSVKPETFIKKSGFFGWKKTAFPGEVRIYRVRNWKQCGDRGLLRAYTVLPEILYPVDGTFDLPARSSAMFVAQFRIPEDVEPGVYEGDVRFWTGNERRTARVTLNIPNIRLKTPDPQDWQMISHIGSDRYETLVATLTEAKRRGFESMLMAMQYGRGGLQLKKSADGGVEIASFTRLDNAVAAYRAAGLKGTLFLHFSDKLEAKVSKALGIDGLSDKPGEKVNVISEMETPAFKRACVQALQGVKARCGDIPIAILGMDEPMRSNSIKRASYEIARIREAGLRSCLYGNGLTYWNMKPDIMITLESPAMSEYARIVADAKANGRKVIMYDGSGGYFWCFGGMMPSRFVAGWGEYLAQSSGHTHWAFGANGPTDFDGIAHFKDWISQSYYDESGRLLFPIEFEGAATGVADYRWILTLEDALKRNASKPCAVRIKADFAALCERLRREGTYRNNRIKPLRPHPLSHHDWTNGDFDRVRERLADWIVELEAD